MGLPRAAASEERYLAEADEASDSPLRPSVLDSFDGVPEIRSERNEAEKMSTTKGPLPFSASLFPVC